MSRILTNKEAMEALLAGKSLRKDHWPINEFIRLDANGEIVDEDGNKTGANLVGCKVVNKIELTEEKLKQLWKELADENLVLPAEFSFMYPHLVKKLGL